MKKPPRKVVFSKGSREQSAGRGTRTPKGSLPEVFETSASTTSATPAKPSFTTTCVLSALRHFGRGARTGGQNMALTPPAPRPRQPATATPGSPGIPPRCSGRAEAANARRAAPPGPCRVCPSSLATCIRGTGTQISSPSGSRACVTVCTRWAVYVCLKVCGVTCFSIPASFRAPFRLPLMSRNRPPLGLGKRSSWGPAPR